MNILAWGVIKTLVSCKPFQSWLRVSSVANMLTKTFCKKFFICYRRKYQQIHYLNIYTYSIFTIWLVNFSIRCYLHKESIARPQVNISHYNHETGCIEIQWEHPQQCIWADVLSNVSSPNASMPSSMNNVGNYTACYEEFKADDVYVFQITPFNKFQVGLPAIISVTIPESELVNIVEIELCVSRWGSSIAFSSISLLQNRIVSILIFCTANNLTIITSPRFSEW